MSRLPFDPGKMAAKATPPTHPPRPAPLSVSQLAALIDRAVRDHTPTGLKVVGEIGQFRERSHWYFDIKDAGAVVSCVMWQSAARKVGFTPKPGQQVLVSGRVEFYPPQGRVQFMADKIEPVGAGALDLALRQLIEEVRALGWLDESRKRPLPAFPRKVAVVTSRTGAALQDVLDTVRRRCPSLQVALADVRVQGEGAAHQVAAAVRAIGAMHEQLGIDVILVTRGGGSMEDLWAFNERQVAEAIVHAPIPVVAAIGHETDITLAELVADLRAATPTQAAMRIAPDAVALREQLTSFGSRLSSLLSRRVRVERDRLRSAARHARLAARDTLSSNAQRVDRLAARLERCRPAAVYAERLARVNIEAARLRHAMHAVLVRHDVDALAARLSIAARQRLHDQRAAVENAARNLDLVGPPSVLARGYSVTLDAKGRPLRSVGDASAGDVLQTRLKDGRLTSVVTASESAGMPEGDLRSVSMAGRIQIPPVQRRKTITRPDDRSQPSLFAP